MARSETEILEGLTSPKEIGEHVSDERKRLLKRWKALTGVGFMHAHSDLIDAAVARILDLAVEQTKETVGQLRSDVLGRFCLIATGGYGRRELCPYSDIDVTFVAANEDDPQVDLLVKNAYRILMDVFLGGTDLKVGYAFRQLGDSQGLPLDTHTALLDGRLLAGSATLFDRFHAEVRSSILPAPFVLGHLNERRASGNRWGHSPYRVEPNLKEGAGGLRDLHAARWMAQVVFGGYRDDAWKTLRARGVVTEGDIRAIDDAVEFLARLRNCLHIVCGRGTDVLSVERQEQISTILGYRQGAAAFMVKYYGHAETLNRIYRKVGSACREQPLEIESGIVALRDDLCVSDFGLFSRDPEAMIRVFEHSVALNLHIGRNTTDLLNANTHNGKGRRRSQGVFRAFLSVLSEPNAHRALADMADSGILQWLIPEFGQLMHQVPGDVAHELTVGAHSLEAVRTLGSFAAGVEADMLDVWSGIQEPELLLLATLLHDIGKADVTGEHEVVGAAMAHDIGTKLGLSAEALGTVEFLIRNHLVMSETARLRDLNDQQAVQAFVQIIDSPERLDMLYLLTAADLRSVGQATWSEMQMRFLRELYHRSVNVLRRTGQSVVDVDRHRSRLARELSLTNLPQAEVDEHCQAMPASYLLNTAPNDIAAHIEYIRLAREGRPTISMRDDPTGKLTEVMICTPDDPTPGLLARIAGALYVLNVGIHAAQVFTRETSDRIALDVLYVDFDHHALPQMKKLQMQSELEALLCGKTDLKALSERFGRKLAGRVVSPEIEVISHLSDRHSIVQVTAEDQPGLLYRLTKSISSLGWDIHSARINTWGDKALDVFYVTDADGNKLCSEPAPASLRKALAD